MKKILNSKLSFVLLSAALFCCAFLIVCSIFRHFRYYAIELLQMSWDTGSWATMAFVSAVVLLPVFAASVWIQVKNGRLVFWKSSKTELIIVTVLVTVLIAIIYSLVRYSRFMNLTLRILALPFAAMGGWFSININGDLFEVQIAFKAS